MNPEHIPLPWLMIGFTGQALFSSRFLIQWIASERRKASVIPDVFWWFSLGGGATLLLYALYRQDPVFILGQVAGLVVYFRNLVLLRRQRLAERSSQHAIVEGSS